MFSHADPFFGNGETDLPSPGGLAARWFYPKAQTGNTHPAASLPFGLLSAGPYSGAYPTGYGLNAASSYGKPPRMFDEYVADGFTHFHASGTGAIGAYYNYFKVMPSRGDFAGAGRVCRIREESARPGYYSCRLVEAEVKAELTIARKAAFHRYSFYGLSSAAVAVDFCHGGLRLPGCETEPTEGWVRLVSPVAAEGYVLMDGVPLYVRIELDAPGEGTLWTEHGETPRTQMVFSGPGDIPGACGVLFRPDLAAKGQCVIKLGFSFANITEAEKSLAELGDRDFEQVAREAQREWTEHFAKIMVAGGTETERKIFYSSLYHSFLKPAYLPGENPFGTGECFTDFATLWDQYKTHLPLLLTICPERGRQIVNSLVSIRQYAGEFPVAALLSSDFTKCRMQARGLVHHVMADAYNRGTDGVDWEKILLLMEADILSDANHDFLDIGVTARLSHTLDLAEACWCTARLAQNLGHEKRCHRMLELAGRWRNAYDAETGMLKQSTYYEGGLWNYSFRLLHDMESRIALTGKKKFISLLDRFFGYGCPPVESHAVAGQQSMNRFEGFNNEPDLETPYAYIYAGCPDRTAEIVRTAAKYSFAIGRGGLPGNNDSGGLTSTYIWNAVGLFPVAGKNEMLIGSPVFDSAVMKAGENEFQIIAENNTDTNLYVKEARLNNLTLDRRYLTVNEFMAGGRLILRMGSAPGGPG